MSIHHLLGVPLLLAVACGSRGGSNPGDDDDDGGGQTCSGGLGDWTGHDDVAASQSPPCGLAPSQVPQFVSIGFDDNGQVEGMSWALGMLEARGNATFFLTSSYAQAATWKTIHDAGHEVGNHTVTHTTDRGIGVERWLQEMNDCNTYLTGTAGIPAADIYGFRTPYLKYDDDTLAAEQTVGFRYDTSIEEGYEWEDSANGGAGGPQDGTNFYWPYTLDHRSPGHTAQVEWGEGLAELTPHAGLWELPVYSVIVPPALRATMAARQTWFDAEGGLITGFDYNLWASVDVGGFAMTKEEFVATLEYTLDQRLAGNRAPFLFGAHTDYYAAYWNPNATGTPSELDRRAAIEEFLDYARSKEEVQVVSYKHVLDWVRNPEPLP
jgi:peptidoglycan/xylan/chitin deacetylase (PgdA/CDA1 family)